MTRQKKTAGGEPAVPLWHSVAWATFTGGVNLVLQEFTMFGVDHYRVMDVETSAILWRARVDVQQWAGIPPERRVEAFMSVLARLAEKRAGLAAGASAALDPSGGLFPGLVEMISTTTFPDGKKRIPSKVTVMVEEGIIKAALRDEGMQASLFRSGPTIEAALEALERALSEDNPDDWRPWPKGGQGWKKGGK